MIKRRMNIWVIVGTLLAVFLLRNAIFEYATVSSVSATVEKRELICAGGDEVSCKYLIFTNSGVYEDTDTMWFWKWDSSDLYGLLKEGHTYRLKKTGWRVQFFSWYPNIVSAEEVPVR